MQHSIDEIADRFVQARTTKTQIDGPVVGSADEAYAIQHAIARRLGGFGLWKSGFLPATPGLSFAPISPATVFDSGVRIPAGTFHMIGLEGEMIFRIDRAIAADGPELGRADILDAIGEVRAGIEIVDTRLREWRGLPPLTWLADSMVSGGLVIGEALPNWREIDLSAPGFDMIVNGAVTVPAGRNAAGDLVGVIEAWLRHCRAFGIDVPAGARLATGSSVGLIFVAEGDRVAFGEPGRPRVEAAF